MKYVSQFFANITKIASASGIQFLITLVATPIMTRLYLPEAYATFGIVNTTATVLVGIGLLTLPSAYAGEKQAAIRSDMVVTMLVLLAGLVALAVVGALGMAIADAWHVGIHVPFAALVLLPVLVLSYGVRQIMVNMTIQRGDFNQLSLGQLVEPVCARGASIALGAGLGGHPALILASVIFGHLSTIFISRSMMVAQPLRQWRRVIAQCGVVRSTLRRFGDFIIFGTAAQQAQQVILLSMQMGIAAFFSAHLAGQYILAVSILTLPVSLLALATSPVVYHHFIETEKNAPANLFRQTLYALGLYLVAGFVILLPIFLYGEIIFRIAFGDIWEHAGRIAGILSVAYVGIFTLTGVQSIFMITRRMKTQFRLEVFTCVVALLLTVISFKSVDFDRAIVYLSLIWLFRSIVLLWAVMVAAYQHPHRVQSVPHD